MRIELTPSEYIPGKEQFFTARFLKESELIAEIIDAPHEIALRWAEAMKAFHDGLPEIKRLGVCLYCGSTRRKDQFCGDCSRVVRA